MKLFLFFILTIFAITANAVPVNSIKYEGMIHISEPVALRMLDFKVGEDIDEELVDIAVSNYFKQGYFKDAWADYSNGILTFHFVEKAVISQVALEGWKENDEEEVKGTIIQIKKGSLYNESKLEAAKKRIIEALSQEGKIDSVVEIEEEKLENGSIKVTFVVNEGEKIIIQKLEYVGVNGLDYEDFDEVIANKEHQWMGWFFGRNDGKMQLGDLAYDNLRIRDYYMQYGYLDSKVNSPFVRVNFDSYTAEMSYYIKEGPVYTINSISVNQTVHVMDTAKILEEVTLEKGEVFNIKTFRKDADTIKTLIADRSYAFAQVVPDLKKNKENNTVDVVFKVIPGDKVRIRDVVISGNTRTLDRVIRRELYLGPGDMYSLTDLTDSRYALGRLGYFDENAIEEKRIDNKTIDLIVKVKEAATGNIQVGGGYGSYGGLLVTLGVSDSNVWGSGLGLGIELERSQMTESASINLSNPRLNDSDFSGNVGVSMSSMEYEEYTVESAGFNLGTGHRLTRNLTAYLGYGYSVNEYSNWNIASLTPAERDYYESYYQSYSKSSVTLSLKYDSTDDYYLARRGIAASQSIEKAGVSGDADFVKSRTTFSVFKGLEDLVGFDAIARYKSRYYQVWETGFLPINEKFYMGGIGSVRGYESYSISPEERYSTSTTDTIKTGGTVTFSNSAEISFPLVPKAKMRFVTFVDWGFLGEDTLSEFSKGSYGVGLEWFSPVGPIQIMFAKPLKEEEGDHTSNFEFTMGQRF
ncbi:MAG: outer membrane protein assembly factor BamA [Epsilonproteobacteria bacterium]|nr:MAG: outer membrane protein assembly factor BamA [Campylobacterota bacterium]